MPDTPMYYVQVAFFGGLGDMHSPYGWHTVQIVTDDDLARRMANHVGNGVADDQGLIGRYIAAEDLLEELDGKAPHIEEDLMQYHDYGAELLEAVRKD